MKNKYMKKIFLLLSFALLSSAVVACSASDVLAYSPADMTKKAVMQALAKCYSEGGVKNEIKKIGDYKGLDSIYNKSVRGDFPLPTSKNGTYHNINDNDLSCKDVIKGYSGLGGNIQNAYALMGHPAPSSSNGAADWLGKYGGYQVSQGSASRCVKFEFNRTPTGGQTYPIFTDQICVDELDGDVIKSDPKIVKDGGHGSGQSHYSGPGGSGYITRDGFLASSGEIQVLQSPKGGQGQSGYGDVAYYKSISAKGRDWEAVVNDVLDAIGTSSTFKGSYCTAWSERQNNKYCSGESGTVVYNRRVDVSGEAAGTINASFHDPIGAKAVAFLYGYTGEVNDADRRGYGAFITSGNRYTVSNEEKIHLYMYYFQTIMGAKISCSVTPEQASGNGYQGPIKWFLSGEKTAKDCYVTGVTNKSAKVNGVDSGGFFQHNNLTYDDLYNFFKTLTTTTLTDGAETSGDTNPVTPTDPTDPTDPSDPSGPTPEKEQPATCYDNAGSLGWILCPIVEQLADAIQKIYEAWIVPFLYLDTELFKSDSDTYKVWSGFRDIANLGFIIFFIIVIFSQLTGFGIDNYGIKKILPKLIMGALLINLSYIICQLAVDISNILGYALGNVFDQFSSSTITTNVKAGSVTVALEFAAGAAIIVAVVAAITAAAILAIGPEIIIPVFLALIGIIIGIIFCFVLLVVRKAFAVILVVISPLAFMCYILPNTKSLYDKWFQSFKAMLLAFPICSAMIYGGQFVGRLLVSASASSDVSFAMAVSAAVISIVPIFMIPSVLRRSLGAISNGITRFQHGLTAGARGTFMRSGYAQEKRLQSMQYRNARRAGFQASVRDGSVLTDSKGNLRMRGARYDRKGNLKSTWGSAFYGDDYKLKTGRIARIRRALGGNSDRSIAAAAGRMLNDINMQPPSTENMKSAYDISQSYNDAKFEKGVGDFMGTSTFKAFSNGDLSTKKSMLASLDGTTAAGKTAAAAFARAMASGTGVEKKALASMIQGRSVQIQGADGSVSEGKLDSSLIRQLSGESSIRNSITDKGKPLVSKYMEAVSADASMDTSYDDWIDSDSGKAAIAQLAMDTDKPEDLASYDAGTFNKVINATTDGEPLAEDHSNAIISDELIQRTLDDKNLSSKLKSDSYEMGDDGKPVKTTGHLAYAASVRGLTPSVTQATPDGELNVRQDSSSTSGGTDSNARVTSNENGARQEQNATATRVGTQTYFHKVTGEKVRGYKMSDGSVRIMDEETGDQKIMNQNEYTIVRQNPNSDRRTRAQGNRGGSTGGSNNGAPNNTGASGSSTNSSSNAGHGGNFNHTPGNGGNSNHTPSTGGDQNNA